MSTDRPPGVRMNTWRVRAQTSAAIVGTLALVLGCTAAVPTFSPVPDATALVLAPSPTHVSPDSSPTLSPTSSPPPNNDVSALIVSVGDEVTATGRVTEASGSLFLCGQTGQFVSGGKPSLPCWGVPVTAVDQSTLPGWSSRSGRSDNVTIRGTWTSSGITVETVGPVVPSTTGLRPPPALACAAPPDGWQEAVPDEAAVRPLNDEVTSHPDLYSGLWSSAASPVEAGGRSLSVAVVGTVGDVDAIQKQLAQIYTYNLCVTKVDYSRSALQFLQTRLQGLAGREAWVLATDTGWDRVHLQLLVVDTEATQLIGADADKIEIDPLVQRATG